MNNIALELLENQRYELEGSLKSMKQDLATITDMIVKDQNKLTGVEHEIATLKGGMELSALNEMLTRVIQAEAGHIEPEVNMALWMKRPNLPKVQ